MGNIIMKAKKDINVINKTNKPNVTKFDTEGAEKEDTNVQPHSARQIMDYIATYYILTLDFISLRKLYDKEYCDKLVILTSEIIEKQFTDMEITYLSEDIHNTDNESVDEANNSNLKKDKILFVNRDNLKNADIQDPIQKKHICNGIAKFYIKIAHVFATILTTINPIYTYKDKNGNEVQSNIYNKSKIPKDVVPEIYKMNICDNRINALKRDLKLDATENEEVTIHPKVCSLNIKQKNDNDLDVSGEKTLEDEPGIPELMELYYDDNYDFETGKFTGMSEETKKLFNENLQYFYKVFSNGKDKPENVKKFSDIKLRDYQNNIQCQGENPLLETKVFGTLTDELFKKYAENIKSMIQKTNENQEQLLKILNKLFAYTMDDQTQKKLIRVNPDLTEKMLQEIVLETREVVVKLYLTCETDYINGVKIYEAIVEKKILETAENQIATFKKMSDQLVTEGIPEPAETRELSQLKMPNKNVD